MSQQFGWLRKRAAVRRVLRSPPITCSSCLLISDCSSAFSRFLWNLWNSHVLQVFPFCRRILIWSFMLIVKSLVNSDFLNFFWLLKAVNFL
jgi:hypothetical protein